MKNIEQILKDAGVELTDEQKAAVVADVGKNYRTATDYDRQAKKLEAAETDRDSYKGQLDTANETLEKFKDINPEKQAAEIEKYKQQAKEAQEIAAKQILERDQRDYLNAEFDRLGISSERTRNSLMRDIMDEKDGLRWKNNAFIGLSDYLEKENEKDHFYQTEEEKKTAADKAAEEESKQKAAESAPKFTDRSENKPASDDKPAFNFGFTPVRAVSKGD